MKWNLIVFVYSGTGFRTPENLNNLIGGSCEKTDTSKPAEHKLRLKIWVCTVEEEARGECERCLSEGCYYQSKNWW